MVDWCGRHDRDWAGNSGSPRDVMLVWLDAQRAFPNVETLSVTNQQVSSLLALTDGAASRPPWRLRRLTLENVVAIEPGCGVVAFLDALTDEHHAMAATLTTLVVVAEQPNTPQPELLAAALRKRSSNLGRAISSRSSR